MKTVSSSSTWADKMDAFLQGRWPSIPVSSQHDQNNQVARRALRWANEIRGILKSLTVLQQAEMIETLASIWQRRRHETVAQAHYAAFKNNLSGARQHWQERLLDVRWAPNLRIHHTPAKYHADAKISLQKSERMQLFDGPQPTLGAIAGSNFCQFDQDGKLTVKNSQVLDSAFSATLFDAEGNHSGFVLSLGDGAGGHLGDVEQDRAIGRAAYFASKQAARLLAALPDSNAITSQILEIVQQVSATIRRKTAPLRESTTLLAIRGFWKPGSPTLRVAGFHIGDSMLWYWHPRTEKVYVLASAKQWESPTGQQATALLPDGYKDHEVYAIDEKLPADGVFFACSDGWYEGLEMKLERQEDSKLGFIRTLIPDEKALHPHLEKYDSRQPVAAWLQQLWATTLQIQDQQREKLQADSTLAVQTYTEHLQTLREMEEKAKTSPAGTDEPLLSLRQNSDYQTLKQNVEESAAKLSQARMGDDVLMVSLAWPRLMPSKIQEEIKERKTGAPVLSSWTHPQIEACEKQITDLEERKGELKSELSTDDDLLPARANHDEQIAQLKEQIKYLKKYPNALYQILKPVIEKELKTEDEFTELEGKLCGDINEILQPIQQRDVDELRTLLRQRNFYGDTILTFAMQSKCYRILQALLSYTPPDVIVAADPQGSTLLSMIYGQRLISDDLSARARSQAGLVKELESKNLLDEMQWRREPGLGYFPIHIAVQKAAYTQQIDPVRVLLNNDPRPSHPGGPWVSQLQLVDGEGDTPLHIAIKVHALTGLGLPIIHCLLDTHQKIPLQGFKNPLYAVNRAGQTVFDLTAALRQSRPLWGDNVWEELQRAATHYRQQLLNWDFKLTKEEKYNGVGANFSQSYLEADRLIPEEARLYQQLYDQYKEFYQPILNNDIKQAEVLLRALEHPDGKQIEMIKQFVADFDQQHEEFSRCQKQVECLRESLTPVPGKISWRLAPQLPDAEMKKIRPIFGIDRLQEIRKTCREDSAALAEIKRLESRVNELAPLQQRNQAKADFYREIITRADTMPFYRTLLAALGPVTRHWPQPSVVATGSPVLPAPIVDDKESFEVALQQALQYAKRLAADDTQPAAATLQRLLCEFGDVEKQAEIIGCFDFKRVPAAGQQKKLLEPLFGKSMTHLTLRSYDHCDAVWEKLFKKNIKLQTLELVNCGGLHAQHFEQLAQWCRDLSQLIIRGTALIEFFSKGMFSDTLIRFPALLRLEFDQCHTLKRIECESKQLTNFNVHDCDQLTQVHIMAGPELRSIGCRNTPLWRSLETDQPDLKPLARELKIAKVGKQSRSALLTLQSGGITPLHRAAAAGELAVLRWLLDQGSSIDPVDSNDKTPLHYAVEKGRPVIVQYLLNHGAGAEMRDNEDRTALHYAAMQNNLEMVKILCATGMNPLLVDREGRSPIEWIRFNRSKSENIIADANEIENQLAAAARHYVESHPISAEVEAKEQKSQPLSSVSAPIGGSALFTLPSTGQQTDSPVTQRSPSPV
jgi:ankyrin repeat protein